MALLAALALRRRRERRQNNPRMTVDNEPRPEVPSTGGSQLASRPGHCDCQHDPASRAIADFICNSVTSVTKPSPVDKKADNGLGSKMWVKICSSERLLLTVLVVIRVLNCLLIQTSYVPDEYWQSVEVAHKSAFGYGYLTWEWKEKIRSFLYPAVFACAYKAAEMIGFDSRAVVVLLPRLMQSVLAAIGDLCLYRMSCRLAGSAVAQCALMCQLLSWYTFYTCTRTLANSTEVSLTAIALSYYPFKVKEARTSGSWKFLWVAALTCLIRPTAAVIWLPLCMGHIWACRHDKKCSVLVLYILTAVFFVALCLRIDKSFYGAWVFTPYNFLEFNVLSKLSSFYGVHPWHWYLTQGLPAILGPHAFVFAASLLSGQQKQLHFLVLYVVLVYSLLPHKEFRFISSVMPVIMHLCGYWITARHEKSLRNSANQPGKAASSGSSPSSISERGTAPTAGAAADAATAEPTETRSDAGLVSEGTHAANSGRPSPSGPLPAVTRRRFGWPLLTTRRIFAALAAGNLPLMAYFSLLHQRGGLDAMAHLHAEFRLHGPNASMAVLFLMPCHSTPFYSHLHANVSMRFLTCEPPLPRTRQSGPHEEEAEEFYKQPLKWLKTNVLHSNSVVPTHLVMYDTLQPTVAAFIKKGRYVLTGRFFHTHFPSGRMGREVLVYRRSNRGSGDGATATASARSAPPTEPKQAADEQIVLPSYSA